MLAMADQTAGTELAETFQNSKFVLFLRFHGQHRAYQLVNYMCVFFIQIVL